MPLTDVPIASYIGHKHQLNEMTFILQKIGGVEER